MIMIRNKMNLRYTTAALAACLLCACRPEMPATSTITIDLTRPTVAVDRDLYGVTPEGEAEALGGWAAEMIRNGSFEANDAEAADSIVGWRPLNASSTLMIDTRAPLSETNRRSLLARGGAVADASHSIAIARGQRFNLTCYLHGTVGNTLTISLRDSAGCQLAAPLRLPLPDTWTELHHSFTATDSARSATLVFEADSGASFGLDMVSLLPQATWRDRPGGLRADLIEAIAELHPRFIRFSGRMPSNDGTRRVSSSEYTQLSRDLNVRPMMIAAAPDGGQRYTMSADLLTAHADLFTRDSTGLYATSSVYADAFGAAQTSDGGTMRAAVGEAAFLIGVERRPGAVRCLAYTPLVGGLLLTERGSLIRTPSYYVWQLFANHRGRRLLHTDVATARKPLITCGRASVAVMGDAFAVEWADTVGNAKACNYTFTARLLRKSPGSNGAVRLQVRDNGLPGARRDAIALELTDSTAQLIHLAGTSECILAGPVAITRTAGWIEARVECSDEVIRCSINNQRIIEASVPSCPSIVAVATLDPGSHTIILKVVNTTQHDERTALRIEGGSIASSAHIVSLAAPASARNTPDHPTAVAPVIRNVRLSRWPTVYAFPANSVTILTLKKK